MCLLTVSLALFILCPFFHQVMEAGGLDPEDWQSRSYRLLADSGWFEPRMCTVSGGTVGGNVLICIESTLQ